MSRLNRTAALLACLLAVGCATKPQRPSVAKAEAFRKAVEDSRPKESFFARLNRPRVESVSVPAWEDTPVRDPARMKLAYAKWMASSGNAAAAAENFEAVLAAEPDNVEALLGLAKIEADSGRAEAAAARFRRIGEVAPDSAEALAARGEFALMQGRPAEAASLLSQALQRRPRDTAVKHRLGLAMARQGRTEEARQLFVATVGPAEAAYQIGLLLKPTRPQAAAAEFRKALALKPTLAEARRELLAMGAAPAAAPPAGVSMPNIRPASHSGGLQ